MELYGISNCPVEYMNVPRWLIKNLLALNSTLKYWNAIALLKLIKQKGNITYFLDVFFKTFQTDVPFLGYENMTLISRNCFSLKCLLNTRIFRWNAIKAGGNYLFVISLCLLWTTKAKFSYARVIKIQKFKSILNSKLYTLENL